jgi:hypothetical protein
VRNAMTGQVLSARGIASSHDLGAIAKATKECYAGSAIGRALRHERARLRRPTPATPFPEERSCARPPRDDSFVTRAATRSRLLIQARNPAARAPSSDSCSAFVRSVSLAMPTSLLCSRKALTARPRSLQVRCTRCNGGGRSRWLGVLLPAWCVACAGHGEQSRGHRSPGDPRGRGGACEAQVRDRD